MDISPFFHWISILIFNHLTGLKIQVIKMLLNPRAAPSPPTGGLID